MKLRYKLIPKTLRGKNKLQNKVNLWEQIETGSFFWNDKEKVCIQEINPAKAIPDSRWVHPTNDPDFTLEVVVNET